MAREQEIVKALRKSEEWIPELCEELCGLAGMDKQWEEADGDNFEDVLFMAAKKLNVNIW